MTRAQRSGLLVTVVALFLLVMTAAAVQGAPTIRPVGSTSEPLPPETMPELSESTGTPAPLESNPITELIGSIAFGILMLLAAAGAVALIVLVIRALLRAWRDRPLARRDGGETGTSLAAEPRAAEPEIVATLIQRGIAGALHEIEAGSIPSDAIIAAWVGLEESAADAGLTRGPSETPAEFTVRIISRRAGISSDARILLRLYERVRFGGYFAVEDDREIARSALRSIEAGWR